MRSLTSKGQTGRKYLPHSKDRVNTSYIQEFKKGNSRKNRQRISRQISEKNSKPIRKYILLISRKEEAK